MSQAPSSPLRVVHVINCLSTGGTERLLLRLLRASDRRRFDHRVITLLEQGELRRDVEALGVATEAAGLHGMRSAVATIRRLSQQLESHTPHVVCSWLYYANAATSFARLLAARRASTSPAELWPLVWNIRQSVPELRREPLRLRIALRANAWLSRREQMRPQAVLYNAARGAADHRDLGITSERPEVIANGLDVDDVPVGIESRRRAREALGIAPDALLVGAAGRDDPVKDHVGLVTAFARVAVELPHARLVIAGPGVASPHAALDGAVARHALQGRVQLLGVRDDWLTLLPGLDCFVSSSLSEGFPNAVAEAMAAGVPVVATDVGDTATLVGGHGTLVPARDLERLATAIAEALRLPALLRARRGEASRRRIATEFSIRSMAKRYESLFTELAAR